MLLLSKISILKNGYTDGSIPLFVCLFVYALNPITRKLGHLGIFGGNCRVAFADLIARESATVNAFLLLEFYVIFLVHRIKDAIVHFWHLPSNV